MILGPAHASRLACVPSCTLLHVLGLLAGVTQELGLQVHIRLDRAERAVAGLHSTRVINPYPPQKQKCLFPDAW